MKKHSLLLIVFLSFICFPSIAQMVGTNCYLKGTYLEIGMNNNGSFGACNAQGAIPAGMHPHTGTSAGPIGSNLAEVYDYGHDGWAVGGPAYMGDYTYPGSPFEGWEIQVGAGRARGFQVCAGTTAGTAGYVLAGSLSGYSAAGGAFTGTWTGTFTSGAGNLAIRQETKVGDFSSWVIVTTVMVNTGATATGPVYYLRSCDPDNAQTWPPAGFQTTNTIVHQNEDVRHRVLVSARSNAWAGDISYMGLGTRDCRARCFSYSSWPININTDLAPIWAGGAGGIGAISILGQSHNNLDYAYGLVYNIGSIAPGDSALISYAYIFNGNMGIDSAFPDPQIVVNNVPLTSWAPPTPNFDTFDACLYPGLLTIPVDLLHASTAGWSWSKWTWAPATGLATTTGVSNTITIAGLPPTITYTITGTDSGTGMGSCHNKTFYLTIHTCNGAEANEPCVGDSLIMNAPGDSTGATYVWYGPAPLTTTVGTTQSVNIFPALFSHNGTYTVIKTVGGLPDTSTVDVTVNALPVVTAASSQVLCAPLVNPLNLFCTTDSVCTSWSWTGPGGFTSGLQNPTVSPFDISLEGVYSVSVVSTQGCKGAGDVLVKPGPDLILGPGGVCQYFSITMTDATPGGTWSSGSPAIARIDASTGVVDGLVGGTATISYTLSNGCAATTVVTVHAKPMPPVVPEVRPCQFTLSGALSVTVAGLGYTSTWYGPGVTGPTTFTGGVSTFVPTTTTVGSTYYYVTQTSPFGCVSDSALYPVNVIAEPELPIPHDTGYCQYDLEVAPIKALGDSLRWYTSLTGSGSFTAPVPTVTSPGITTYYVTQEQSGCESQKAPLTVTVYVLPDFEITAERDWVCQFDSLQLFYDGPSYVDPGFAWTLPVGSDFVNGTKFDNQNIMARFDTVWGRHIVRLTVSNYGGRCSSTDTLPIRVVPAPDAHAYIKPDVCLGDTITLALTTHTSNSNTYTWMLDGSPMFTSPKINVISQNVNTGGPYVISWNDSGLHIINVSSATVEGCTAPPTADTVKVHTLPDSRFTISQIPTKFCVEDSVLFTAMKSDYSYGYKWEPEHSFVNQNKPEVWGRVEMVRSRIMLTVTDPFGCRSSYSKVVNPDECCNVTMPNAFTPNGDGLNDRFRPIFDGYRRFHIFRITNRWGQTVFESANSNPSWDGTFNGNLLDMGTYFYYLKYDCGGKALDAKGDVILVR